MSRAVATAVLTPGAITERVERVGPPSLEARELLQAADDIAVLQRRPEDLPSAPRQHTHKYTVICVSTYWTDLAALDAAVERLKAAGLRRASRSWLIRVAIARLDLEAVLTAELARTP